MHHNSITFTGRAAKADQLQWRVTIHLLCSGDHNNNKNMYQPHIKA